MLPSLVLLLLLSTVDPPCAAWQEPPEAVRADALARAGQWRAAAEAYRKLLAREQAEGSAPDGPSADGLGRALFALGDWRGAAEAFERAARTSPVARPDALYCRACALARAEEPDEALAVLRQALEAGYLATRSLADGPPTASEIAAGLGRIVDTLLARHPDPFRLLSRAEWEARRAQAIARSASLDEAQYLVEGMRLASAAGDVHTSVYPGPEAAVMQRAVPVVFWKFPDGLRIRAAAREQAELLGARVLAFGDTPVAELWPRLFEEFHYENEWMAAGELAFFLRFPDFHRGLGLASEPDALALRLALPDGTERSVVLRASERGYAREANETRGFGLPPSWIEAGPKPAPLWLGKRDTNYWLTVLPEARTVYFQLNLPRDAPTSPWSTFLDELVATVRREGAERLVIDLRHNPGGWGPMGYDLAWRLRELPEVNRPGHLFVLIGRLTQSAGVVIAAELERHAHAVFVGEPLAAHPNFFNGRRGNHPPLLLPGRGIRLRVSEVEEQNSDALDPRRFVAPDLPAPLTWEDLAAGRDPALELALDVDPERAARLLDDAGGRPLEPWFRWQRPTQYPAFGRPEEHPLP